MPTFSVKLDEQSRAKVQAAAIQRGVTPHAFMVQAIELAVTRSEEEDALVQRALQARQNLLQTGMVVDGSAMAEYLKDKVRGGTRKRPAAQGLEQLLAPAVMTRLVHSPEAANDLEELVDFLLVSRPEHAVETVDLVLDALSVLERHPLMGRPVAQGMRELVISRGRSGYLALYAFDAAADVVFVLAIKHQREQDYH